MDARDESPTRLALGEALKRALVTTPLDRVTVSGLTAAAGITRQAFYYHFSDVHDLAAWLFKHEIAHHVMSHATHAEWSEGFLDLLLWMREHAEQTRQTVRALTHEDLVRFIHAEFRLVTTAIVDELAEGREIGAEERSFIIDHYTTAAVGHLLRWLATDMRADPYLLTEKIERIMHGAISRSLDEFTSPTRWPTQPGGASHPARAQH